MKTLSIAAGALLIVFLVAAALVPVFFNGERLKPKAEAELSSLIGRRVSLGSTAVSLWSGLALRAESLRVGEPLEGPAAGAPILEAGPTAVRVALLPLLHKDVQLRSITLERARVLQDATVLVSDVDLTSSLHLAADGTLDAAGKVSTALDLLAGRPRAGAKFAARLGKGVLEVGSLAATVGPLHLDGTGRVEGISASAPRVHLDLAVKLARSNAKGKFDLVVDTNAPTATFEVEAPLLDLDEAMGLAGSFGLAALSDPPAGFGLIPVVRAKEAPRAGSTDLLAKARATGTIKAQRCLFQGLDMTDVAARASLDRGLLRLDDTRISMFGGTARGAIAAHPLDKARPFSLQQKVEGVAIGKMIAALAPAQKGSVEGTAALDLTLTGRAGDASLLPTVDGKGALVVQEGKIASIGVIKQVMKLLETAGAKGIAKDETPFDRLSAHFDVDKGVARTHDLQFRSADLDCDGHGSIGLGGAIDLDVVGSFSKTVSEQLVAKTPALKLRQGADGRLSVPLQVRGTMMEPQVKLDVNAVLHEGLKKEIQQDVKKKLLDRLLKH